ncbi:tensin-4 isoform X2 [Neodiprion pinetum]|uniref:Tensin-1 isoform X2 n=2 Tax=Neodiprion lecontei TaxID=441921 RepID=A0ABM3FY81_NEOLC|nr:tensin-1-like isoform X2 [Neodiprion pinetum]XP_046592970.1 tensin-1 isoform X2 [Neodiprion lecontei]XP_046612332.1 tensin-1-like isoform X2 [Neodiprion virginianus]
MVGIGETEVENRYSHLYGGQMTDSTIRIFDFVQYMGSFAVGSPEVDGRAEYVRSRLDALRHSHRSTPVLLIISLAGIKVCSPDGKIVQMAHALRRISYATCEPRHAQFSFLAREPGAHFSLQYCHSFISETPEQAEELNTIVGNAFRMAYAAQLQRQPVLQEVISPQPTPARRKDRPERTINLTKQSTRGGDSNEKSTIFWPQSVLAPTPRGGGAPPSTAEMNVQLGSAGSPTLRLSTVKTPNSIPGLRPSHNFNNVLGPITNEDGPKSISQQSTPSSDESNSPTELNSYKRLTDKPPLIKRLTMGLAGGRDVLGTNGEDDSCPLVSAGSTPTSPSNRPRSGGYVNEAIIDSEGTRTSYNKITCAAENLDNTINSSITAKNFNAENNRISHNSPNSVSETEFKSKRRSQISTSGSSVPPDGSTHGSTPTQTPTPTPPPLPERTDSLNNRTEESELRKAPWFQAGIPREITLEVLSQEPEGAFMVRESTSKPGCYALSLRVPREFQPSGIAHYLIMRTNKGYKIKGFTKEFTTLTALITHHSVMPELLPCPLSLSRYNPSFVKSDSNKDFADIDSDPDYNTLADFRKMMADLNV